MDKRFILTILVIMLIPITLFSQIKIAGKIVNQKGKALEFVEILLLNKDSITFKSELTNVNGEFKISVLKGNYFLKAKQLGSVLWKQKINGMQDVNLGTITITAKVEQLAEVVVVGEKKKIIEHKIDRTVFNVENTITAAGGDALETLKVTPGVQVLGDQVSISSKNGVRIMVDDRLVHLSGEDLANYLKTIPSENIKSIEIITTPPAKYDAEGNSGLINIKLKTPKEDNWSASVRSSYIQATYPSGRLGGSFSYQENKWTTLLDLNETKSKSIYTLDSYYLYTDNELWNNHTKNVTTSIYSRILYSLGYAVSDKFKLGLQYNGNLSKSPAENKMSSQIFDNTSAIKKISTIGESGKNIYNHAFNFNILQKLDLVGKQYVIDLDYLTYDKKATTNFNSYNEVSEYLYMYSDNDNIQNIDSFSAKIDFTLPFSFINLETGAKTSRSKSTNNVISEFIDLETETIIPYVSQNDYFKYIEDNQAMYVSANKDFNKKWSAKLGLRAEYTQTEAFSKTVNQTNKTDYLKFFPTGYLQYTLNDNNKLSVNYSRRIQRPAYWELNPARKYSSSNSYAVENPFLQPAFSDNIELNHSYKSLLKTSISISKEKNSWGQITVFDQENNTQITTRQNYYDIMLINVTENISFNILNYWESNVSLSAYYSKTNTFSPYVEPFYEGWGGNLYWNNSIILNKAKTITAQFYYQCSLPTEYSYQKSDFNQSVSLGIGGNFLNKRLNVTLKGNDVFKTSLIGLKSTVTGVQQQSTQYYDNQSFQLSATYKWGSDKLNVKERRAGNQEEKSRI